jgi:hypothetical protein
MEIGGAESKRLSGDRIQRLQSAIEVWRGAGEETGENEEEKNQLRVRMAE